MRVGNFAVHLGISRPHLSKVLNGRASITAEMDLKLSEALTDMPQHITFMGEPCRAVSRSKLPCPTISKLVKPIQKQLGKMRGTINRVCSVYGGLPHGESTLQLFNRRTDVPSSEYALQLYLLNLLKAPLLLTF